jgi:hypothetical protein
MTEKERLERYGDPHVGLIAEALALRCDCGGSGFIPIPRGLRTCPNCTGPEPVAPETRRKLR